MSEDNIDQGIPEPEGAANPIDTDYEIGQDNIEAAIGPVEVDVHDPVFLVSALAVVGFVIFTLIFGTSAGAWFNGLKTWMTSNLDWFFLSAANVFILFCVFLIVSPLGRVRLGGTDATPDYSYTGWFAMLFAAGMGIGLMFFGVSEPLTHYNAAFGGISVTDGVRTDGAPLMGAAGDPQQATQLAMAATLFHWALHPWAIYAVVALALALFSFNKGLPLTMRSVFYPIFGERIWGWPGHIVDILAVLATLFGLATSLGYGAEQANAGLTYLFGMPNTDISRVLLIVGITAVATLSVWRGMDGGVKVLSEINMGLAALLMLFVLLVGPTLHLLSGIGENILSYMKEFPALAMPFGRNDDGYRDGWTAFYWAWWISWSPFVGMFIARVSRGRTVREFIICVMLIPSIVCMVWMSIFGGTAIFEVVQNGVSAITEAPLELKLFLVLKEMPLSAITSLIGIILVIVFFVTSSDSGSLVIDTITAGGKIDAPMPQRIFWCAFEGIVAIVLLLGGGLGALQAMAVSTGFPFSIVLLLGCYAIYKGLASEPR